MTRLLATLCRKIHKNREVTEEKVKNELGTT